MSDGLRNIERAEQIAASPMDAAQEEERLMAELREATMREAACGRELSRAHTQLRGAVDALREIEEKAARRAEFLADAISATWVRNKARAGLGGQS